MVYSSRIIHIDVWFHFIREILDDGKILLEKIDTADSLIDILTEIVISIKF